MRHLYSINSCISKENPPLQLSLDTFLYGYIYILKLDQFSSNAENTKNPSGIFDITVVSSTNIDTQNSTQIEEFTSFSAILHQIRRRVWSACRSEILSNLLVLHFLHGQSTFAEVKDTSLHLQFFPFYLGYAFQYEVDEKIIGRWKASCGNSLTNILGGTFSFSSWRNESSLQVKSWPVEINVVLDDISG